MHDSDGWKKALKTNGWTDDFKTGADFTTFLKEQDERVSSTLEDLGLI
jgi:putative tricarboxylic transport membrane protein